MTVPKIKLEGITKSFGDNHVLKGVQELSATTFSTTSDIKDVRQIANKITMIYDSKIIWCGPTADVNNSGNEYLDQFIHNRAEGPIKMAITSV
ncbi:MAG: hypothetical protein QGH63_07685 [Rhodospirillales bacterium]|nr:hypothetical protein [Rhodospirillales bacterium]